MSIRTDALARKALHTLWQTFAAALVVAWGASGLDVSQVTDEASAKKLGLAAAAAVVAAFLSALKTTVAGLLAAPDTVGLNGSSGTGPLVPDVPPVDPVPPVGPRHAAGVSHPLPHPVEQQPEALPVMPPDLDPPA